MGGEWDGEKGKGKEVRIKDKIGIERTERPGFQSMIEEGLSTCHRDRYK